MHALLSMVGFDEGWVTTSKGEGTAMHSMLQNVPGSCGWDACWPQEGCGFDQRITCHCCGARHLGNNTPHYI